MATAPASSPNDKNTKMVLGYFVDGSGPRSSINSMASYSSTITDISGFWYTFDSTGTVYGRTNPSAVSIANSKGIGIYPLVHNIQHGYFNKQLAHNVFSNSEYRRRLVTGITGLAWKDGAKGVVIDIENLYPTDRSLYELFLSELKEEKAVLYMSFSLQFPSRNIDGIK
jgi:spore germination protein YaaH